MIDTNTQATLRERLLEEQSRLLEQLGVIGHQLPDGDWVASMPEMDESEEDIANQADHVERFDSNVANLRSMEARLKDVRDALGKMDAGTYGICEETGHDIDVARLQANPAARNCRDHM